MTKEVVKRVVGADVGGVVNLIDHGLSIKGKFMEITRDGTVRVQPLESGDGKDDEVWERNLIELLGPDYECVSDTLNPAEIEQAAMERTIKTLDEIERANTLHRLIGIVETGGQCAAFISGLYGKYGKIFSEKITEFQCTPTADQVVFEEGFDWIYGRFQHPREALRKRFTYDFSKPRGEYITLRSNNILMVYQIDQNEGRVVALKNWEIEWIEENEQRYVSRLYDVKYPRSLPEYQSLIRLGGSLLLTQRVIGQFIRLNDTLELRKRGVRY